MIATSTTYAGEWPPGSGLYWHPGESREVAGLDGAPAGIVAQEAVQPPALPAPVVVDGEP